MHRPLIVAALIAALPLLAFGAGQPPAATEKPHPSASAHANAVAGQANAARLEACDDLSSAMLGALEKGDFEAASSKFDAQMRANLDAKKLGTVWTSVSAKLGALQSRGFPQAAMYQQLFIVVTPLYFQNGGVKAQIVCDMDNRIVGFHLQPLAPAASN
ncbi:MAG TPA: DUF3887 domain-containing protein [Rhodanobacteraceae bacterium]|nr:DUF3887 domain-containing protein [Rhodanobacteraceae bacterium]